MQATVAEEGEKQKRRGGVREHDRRLGARGPFMSKRLGGPFMSKRLKAGRAGRAVGVERDRSPDRIFLKISLFEF